MSQNKTSGKKLTDKTLDKILEVYSEITNFSFTGDIDYVKKYAKGMIGVWGFVNFHTGAYRLFIFKGKKGMKEAERWSGKKLREYWERTEKDYIVQMKYGDVNPSFTSTINSRREFIQKVLSNFEKEGINYFPLE